LAIGDDRQDKRRADPGAEYQYCLSLQAHPLLTPRPRRATEIQLARCVVGTSQALAIISTANHAASQYSQRQSLEPAAFQEPARYPASQGL